MRVTASALLLVRRRMAYANGIHALDLLRFYNGSKCDAVRVCD